MNKLIQYLRESREEFMKVTWPTRKEVINYSLLVIGISIFVAAYIGVVDLALNRAVEFIIDEAPGTQITPTEAGVQPTGNGIVPEIEPTPNFEIDGVETVPVEPAN